MLKINAIFRNIDTDETTQKEFGCLFDFEHAIRELPQNVCLEHLEINPAF